MAIPTAFISSTCEDLRETGHRDAIRAAIQKTRLLVEMQEYWENQDNPPLDVSLQKVANADILIIAVAHRFGWIPPGRQKSITWLECEEAVSRGKKVLAYIIADEYEYPSRLRDTERLTQENEDAEKLAFEVTTRIKGLKSFKEWLRVRFTPTKFSSAENLGQQVETDLIRWAQSQDLPTGSFTNQRDGSLMVRVPAGGFVTGHDLEDESEGAGRAVELDEFYISKYPITNKQYSLFVNETNHRSTAIAGSATHPVVGVSWKDAQAYCKWAQLCLPNEYQWEKAARGIDGRKYPWGNFGPVESRANCQASKMGGTTPVTEFPNSASPHGCVDMAGNAFEWCLDQFANRLDGVPSTLRAEVDDAVCFRVVRGGAWNDVADRCRCAYRGRRWQEYRFNNVGFRVVFSGITQEMVDGWFGHGNWFCYPDRRTGVGVTSLPKIVEVPELIDYIEAGQKIYDHGQSPVPEIGANVELRLPIAPDQTPEWQRTALNEWVAEQGRDAAPLTQARLDGLFGTSDWSRDPDMTFLVDVNLPAPLQVRYPITGVAGFDKSHFGVGQICPAGRVKASLAGDLPEEYAIRSQK
jgi:formylglycine-generating enzyme